MALRVLAIDAGPGEPRFPDLPADRWAEPPEVGAAVARTHRSDTW